MKTCPNCRVVYEDDYAGQCSECGKPLGGVAPNGASGGKNLSFDYAKQVQAGAMENAQESAMKRGDYSRVPIEDRLMEVAKAGAYLLEKAAGREWVENE